MVQGVVVLIGKDVVFVDVGGKGEATMDRTELQNEEGQLTVEVGATVEAVVVSTAGGVTLSHKLARGADHVHVFALDLSCSHRAVAFVLEAPPPWPQATSHLGKHDLWRIHVVKHQHAQGCIHFPIAQG